VRFQVLDIIPHQRNPVTGRLVSPSDRLAQTVQTARRAVELGFDAFALGERHHARRRDLHHRLPAARC
jgi:alkanesulfonate monooxygenase SsuD/methylene tetrahydromethanopterin reductase-like flavin-dependent oxidoreductase (luciferase family)